MRQVRSFVWVSPDDCEPPHGLDMESERDFNKVEMLRKEFETNGFDLKMPALVGYPLEGRIQLLSGTHRHLAAKQAGILLPVTLWLRSDIEKMWGTDMWDNTIKDISVADLMTFMMEDGFKVPPHEPVDVNQIYNSDLSTK